MIGKPALMAVTGVVAILAPHDAVARTSKKPGAIKAEAEIGACIRRAAADRPWLEKTLWGLRDQEAGWVGAQIRNRNGTHDLGPLQVNSWWVARIAQQTGRPPAHVRYWLIHDACFNVDAARWIFLTALASTGDFWKAIGVYHSPTSWRQRRYAHSVSERLRSRFGDGAFR